MAKSNALGAAKARIVTLEKSLDACVTFQQHLMTQRDTYSTGTTALKSSISDLSSVVEEQAEQLKAYSDTISANNLRIKDLGAKLSVYQIAAWGFGVYALAQGIVVYLGAI